MVDMTSHRENILPLSNHDIDKAFQLLHQEQYELLATLLIDFQSHAARSDLPVIWEELLMMLRHLALMCHLLNKSAVWHEEVSEQAYAQIVEVTAALRDFLQVLHDGNWNNLFPQVDQQASFHETFSPNGHVPQSLWERIKSLFQSNGATSADAIEPPVFTALTQPLSDNGKSQAVPHENQTDRMPQPADNPLPVASDISQDDEQTLLIYGLGVFGVYHEGKLINDWATRKSKLVFKYLLLHREKPIPKEMLMEVFWPDSDETAARNNLNVTVYNLRQVFGKIDSSISYVLYQDDCYLLNPDLHIWFDYDVFRQHYVRGSKFYKQMQTDNAIREFQAAELVYQGELFEEDRYDDWFLPQREAAHNHYVQVLEHLSKYAYEQQQYMECINLCHKLLTVDACLEDSHRLLIKCYMQQGQNHLAIRQYYTCVQTLEDELGVMPSQDTVALYEQLRTTMRKGS